MWPVYETLQNKIFYQEIMWNWFSKNSLWEEVWGGQHADLD